MVNIFEFTHCTKGSTLVKKIKTFFLLFCFLFLKIEDYVFFAGSKVIKYLNFNAKKSKYFISAFGMKIQVFHAVLNVKNHPFLA